MGKIETWEVAGRTDETMTLLFKRRVYSEEKYALSSGTSSKKVKDEDGFDEETRAVLEKLEDLNKRIRQRYCFDSKNPKKIQVESGDKDGEKEKKKEKKKEEKAKPKKEKSEKSEDSRSLKEKSIDDSVFDDDKDSHVVVNGVLVKKGTGSEPCDHRGVPLSHPMAMTPYPGASTAAQREKARKMLKEVAKKMYEDDLKKQAESSGKGSEKDKTIRSAKTSNLAKTVEKSKSNTSKSSHRKMGCDKCGSCQKCIHRCSQKHAAEQKVTDAEREQFLKSIKQLRKRIVKPERSREKATKSPYDVTQSHSETDVSKSSTRSKKKSQEK